MDQNNKNNNTAPAAATPSEQAATATEPAKATLSKRREVKDQRTVVRKRDKALLSALGVFTLVMAIVAVLGILLVHEPKEFTQGQADCDVVRVSGKLPGRIVKFYVHEGDYVHKGDTLVSIGSKTIDASLYKAQKLHSAAQQTSRKVDKGTRSELKQAAADVVAQAQAAADIARKTYQRMDNLYKDGVVTAQKRDEAKAALDAAEAALRTAKSQQALADNGNESEEKAASRDIADAAKGNVMEVEALLEDQFLLAPCDGEVSEIYPQEGELVVMGTPVMTISKLAEMWVSFSVREEKLQDLPMNKVVNATIPALGKKKTQLQVYYIHDMGSYAVWNATKAYGQYDSKTFEVKCRPVKAVPGLRPGMSVLLDD